MKNKLKVSFVALLVIFITGTWGSIAKANSPNVELEGNAKGIVFINGDEPFLLKENIMPGDTVERSMKIVNRYNDSYKIYLRAKRITEKDDDPDLLNKIKLTIDYDGKPIYNGPVSGEDDLVNDIYLGEVKPGEERKLYAKATFDGKRIGNELKNKRGEVEWIFTAVRVPNNLKKSAKEIENNTQDNMEKISNNSNSDKLVNNTEVPKTGDESLKPIYALLIISVFLELVLVCYKKKHDSFNSEE